MNNYIDVMRRIIMLSDTIDESFRYIQEKVFRGELESLYNLIYDTIYGIHDIQLAMVPFIQKLPPNNIEVLTVELNEGLDRLVSACEKKENNEAYAALSQKLIHAYENWKNELRANMNHYILS